MPALSSGSSVYGRDFPPSQFDQDWTTQANLTNQSYSAGSPLVAVTQVAPSSGKVFVCIGAGTRLDTATTEVVEVTYSVYEDSADGVLVQSAYDQYGVKSAGLSSVTQFHYQGNFSLLTGLTPGKAYYFQVIYRTVIGAGAGNISSRNIMTIPVP